MKERTEAVSFINLQLKLKFEPPPPTRGDE